MGVVNKRLGGKLTLHRLVICMLTYDKINEHGGKKFEISRSSTPVYLRPQSTKLVLQFLINQYMTT